MAIMGCEFKSNRINSNSDLSPGTFIRSNVNQELNKAKLNNISFIKFEENVKHNISEIYSIENRDVASSFPAIVSTKIKRYANLEIEKVVVLLIDSDVSIYILVDNKGRVVDGVSI